MAWDNFISDDITMIVSAWSCMILTLSICALILLNNSISHRISIIVVHNSRLKECWVVQLLVDLKIQSLIFFITFTLVDLVTQLFCSKLLFEGFCLKFQVQL